MSTIDRIPPCNDPRTRGFTLVEVLVSLVILSIGLLGIAKLMLLSSHSNDSAYLRSQATDLAYEMLDYMRANSAQANLPLGPYNTALGAGAVDPGFSCVATVPCANLALYDVYQWKLRLNATSGLLPAGALPNGRGSVATVVAGGQTTATIVVSWDDSVAEKSLNPGAPVAANTQSVTLETVL
ncbi:MAG: type IV pilus modification protein PilV [Pseudomonadota bacterium]|nr:type IV pilus modification protein PilV [Pseudomonadota bacterium]